MWVHDYHLMWLPYELRQRFKTAIIGWFLHTPFPSSEIYRILPVRKPLLEGKEFYNIAKPLSLLGSSIFICNMPEDH